MVRIRLQRRGRKKRPFYAIVAADARTKRDGKFLEKLGTYNPMTNPSTVELNVEAAVKWLQNGAQPSERARRLLSSKGAMLKHHLQIGVLKEAITQEQADEKFEAWLKEKNAKIENQKQALSKKQSEAKAKSLEAEKQTNQKRLEALQKTEKPEQTQPSETAK